MLNTKGTKQKLILRSMQYLEELQVLESPPLATAENPVCHAKHWLQLRLPVLAAESVAKNS